MNKQRRADLEKAAGLVADALAIMYSAVSVLEEAADHLNTAVEG